MSTTDAIDTGEPATNEPRTNNAGRGTAGMAWLAVLVLTGITLLVIVTAAFSQNNAPASVDGGKSTYSQYTDD